MRRAVGIAIVSRPGDDLHGLTTRVLVMPGLFVGGCSNRQVARTLLISRRMVAANVEHTLAEPAELMRNHAPDHAGGAESDVPPPAAEGQQR